MVGDGGGYFGVDGVAIGRDLECEEVECEGDEQEEVRSVAERVRQEGWECSGWGRTRKRWC